MAAQEFSTGSRLLSIGAIAKDAGAAAAGAGGLTLQFTDLVSNLEKPVIGALTIVILVLRLRTHLKGKG